MYNSKQVAKMLFPNDQTKQDALVQGYPNCSANAFGKFVADFQTETTPQNLLANIFKEETVQDMVTKVASKGANITGKDLLGLSIHNYGRSQNDEHSNTC